MTVSRYHNDTVNYSNASGSYILKQRKVIKGEKHHWWPEGLSKFWINEGSLVNRIDQTGKVILSTPKKFGRLSDGHNILLDSDLQFTIEHHFDKADQFMPKIIEWLSIFKNGASQEIEVNNLDILRECIISLVVRSPNYRNAHVSFVESLTSNCNTSTITKVDRKNLIAANINQMYKPLVKNSKGVGKFVILFSEKDEFIYGDGFYSNINVATEHLQQLKLAIPMTPHIAILWSSPLSCKRNPRLISVQVDKEIVDVINSSVQVYSKDYLFFKSQEPVLSDAFKLGEHQIYRHQTDPVDTLIKSFIKEEGQKFHFLK